MDYIKAFLFLTFISCNVYAGDNHVHVEQVNGGDSISLNVDQLGYGNLVRFSTDHSNNTFNLTQKGNNNTISWVPWWGSGKSWGGDVDGTNNVITIEQNGGHTYGAHVWGNHNDVTVTQDGAGEHKTYLDIHASYTDTEIDQDGDGDKYSRVYFYGSTNNSTVDLNQLGSGNHTAYITLQGSYKTDLNLTQQGATNQSYSLTQTCVTVGGCTVNITQQ